jgi:hypothetical protein
MYRYHGLYIIDQLTNSVQAKLAFYQQRGDTNTKYFDEEKKRLELLLALRTLIDKLILPDVWITVEEQIFEMEMRDPNLTTVMIVMRRKPGADERIGYINLDNPNL